MSILLTIFTPFLLLFPSQAAPPSHHPLSSFSKQISGNTPLHYCADAPNPNDLFWIDDIKVDHYPLYIDDVFQVKLNGYFTEDIMANATWTSFTRYGNSSEGETWTVPFCKMLESIDQAPSSLASPSSLPSPSSATSFSSHAHLTEQSQEVRRDEGEEGQGCPPKKGLATVTMEGWVWEMFIVPGDYFFRFEARNGNGRRIYCLEVELPLYYKGGRGRAKDNGHIGVEKVGL